jgi:hypothetical protein
MLMNEDHVDLDGLDDYDRSLASEMDARPIYSAPHLVADDVPNDEDAKLVEREV